MLEVSVPVENLPSTYYLPIYLPTYLPTFPYLFQKLNIDQIWKKLSVADILILTSIV